MTYQKLRDQIKERLRLIHKDYQEFLHNPNYVGDEYDDSILTRLDGEAEGLLWVLRLIG